MTAQYFNSFGVLFTTTMAAYAVLKFGSNSMQVVELTAKSYSLINTIFFYKNFVIFILLLMSVTYAMYGTFSLVAVVIFVSMLTIGDLFETIAISEGHLEKYNYSILFANTLSFVLIYALIKSELLDVTPVMVISFFALSHAFKNIALLKIFNKTFFLIIKSDVKSIEIAWIRVKNYFFASSFNSIYTKISVIVLSFLLATQLFNEFFLMLRIIESLALVSVIVGSLYIPLFIKSPVRATLIQWENLSILLFLLISFIVILMSNYLSLTDEEVLLILLLNLLSFYQTMFNNFSSIIKKDEIIPISFVIGALIWLSSVLVLYLMANITIASILSAYVISEICMLLYSRSKHINESLAVLPSIRMIYIFVALYFSVYLWIL